MASTAPVHKHMRLNPEKLSRAQKLSLAKTETETVERALDLLISEYERDRVANLAHERFIRSGAAVRDVYGSLE